MARKQRGYIDQLFLAEESRRTRDMDARELLDMVRDQLEAALLMLGHARDTAGAIRFLVDDGEVDLDTEMWEMGLYLEDEIDEIENGEVYDLLNRVRDVLALPVKRKRR